jgi:hypothetical protein
MPEGLFEYSYSTASVVAQAVRPPQAAAASSEETSSSYDSPERVRRGGVDGTAQPGSRRSSRLERDLRMSSGDPTCDETAMVPDDMRVLIDGFELIKSGEDGWSSLIQLLKKAGVISPSEATSLQSKCAQQDQIVNELRRKCIDSCETDAAVRPKWKNLYSLQRSHLEHLCSWAQIDEDEMPTAHMGPALRKEISRRQ